ncbi:hypothetical protein V8F33_003296 [Rhypophila sp. PSN 637]
MALNSTTTKQALQRIAESVTDGRAENVRHRQEQLFSLHTTLARDASAICHALAQKTKGSRHDEAKKEAEVEYYLALDAVRHFYDSLDFDEELENEYRVANGKNYQSRRVGYGLVVIRPLEHHSRFYSIIVPLAAALSAGNCVVVEMPKSRPGDENYDIDIQLWTILTRSLDSNIFCFEDDIEEDFSKSDLESAFVLVVDQRSRNSSESSISASHSLVSLSDAPALAIVDRTADTKEAVRLIARASLIFGGTSPYAPDLVLVNEFVKDQVLDAFSETPDVKVEVYDFTDRHGSSLLAKIESNGQRDTGSIAVLPYSSLIDASHLVIVTCQQLTSIDSDCSTQLLAGYFFAEPRAAKYLSQHLPCAISYINQIPTHLLVGPAAPAVTVTTASPGLLYRYTTAMFSRPRPQMTEPPPRAFSIIDHHLTGEKELRNTQNLVSLATKPLRPVVRPSNEDVGFFEAGFLLAAGLNLTPVHLFSHGSTMMLGEESASASYWAKCGREALANGVEHVVMMGAHWATSLPNTVLISANPNPSKSPVAFVAPHKYKSYALNPDMAFIPTIQSHLSHAGIASKLDQHFDWIHDTYLVLIRMFPSGCPPTTIISANYAYDPHFHVSVGAALRPLRSEKTLFIGSGGSVHNLYRNVWGPMLQYRDNFAQPTPPEPWALDFRQEVIDTFCAGYEQKSPLPKSIPYGREIRSSSRAAAPGGGGVGGPLLRRKAASLMKHPKYRDAHATDDHFMATMFVAGLCGSVEDVGVEGVLGAEDWELTNMCNSQFTLGGWD